MESTESTVVTDQTNITQKRWYLPAVLVILLAAAGTGAWHWVSAATTTSSLWSTSTTPKTITMTDKQSVELGLKFTSKVAGQITGIRFYKGAQNTGTHTGSLWDSKGDLLATVTFKGETNKGWQTATFPQPVSIAANVTYVVSYHAPKGHYSFNSQYFAKSAHTNGSLTAPKSTKQNVNGVYKYGTTTTFPNQPSKGDNYWVDVLFTTKLVGASAKPAPPASVTIAQDQNGVNLKWSASLSSNPVSQYNIVRNGSKIATVSSSTLMYSDTKVTAGSTYSYQIEAVDNTGAVSDPSITVSATFNPSSTTPTPPTNPTPPTSPPTTGRTYPMHTNVNATTFWVGEQFQSTADGSQICSAYDTQWQYDFFHLKTSTAPKNADDCAGAPMGGCDALLKDASKPCNDSNSIGSLRTPANGYFPAGLPQVYESPFYLDLPFDDYNPSDKTDTTGYSTRCQVVPWANDSGYAGHCTDTSFSYMKNRFVKVMANGQTCYGQIEDAGPADDGNGNGNYDDANYVFGSNDARPYNKSYDSAGMDVSPALGACLKGTFNDDLNVSWQFVDGSDVPTGPWKTIVTTTPPSGE